MGYLPLGAVAEREVIELGEHAAERRLDVIEALLDRLDGAEQLLELEVVLVDLVDVVTREGG